MLTDMTRGGQVQIHKFRMIKQILAVTFSICLTVMLCTFIYKISQRQNEFELNDAGTYIKAFIANNYHPNKLIHEDKEIYVDVWNSWNHDYHIEKASDIEKYSNRYKTAFYNSIYILKEESIYAGTVGGVVLTLVIVFWIWNGRRSMAKKQITGGKILKPHESNKILAKKNLKSDLKIGDLHLVKEKETSHILITGTTGSGKSNCMYNLLPQVRIKKQGAIIVDFTGNMVERYYEEKREDVILNPFDERSYAWNFWDDVRNSYNTKIIASSLYSSRGYDHDQIWDNSSQQFFIDAVEVTSKKEEKKISTLYELLAIKKLSELTKILSGKPSASVFDSNNDKTAMSVRTNTIAYLDWMKLMIDQDKKDKQISIRECYERAKKGAWIFLSSSPKQRSSLRSFYSVLIELFISELMEHGTSYNRRIWMIIDELFSLKKLPSLPTALSEFRKYGGCILAGTQSMNQLYEIYGHNLTKTMLDQFNTKFVFRTEEQDFINYICKSLGDIEYIESSENLSYGAHEMRDGVNFSKQEKRRPLLTHNDIANLKDLECFVKLPQLNEGVVKLETKFVQFR